jgi:uroporphyrinogen III methyltransferase/synthase
MTNIYRPPQVFIVGAGPGHPGLMTLRAVECLAQADVVLYDKLVPLALLEYAPASAERLCVADLGTNHCERYRPVNETLLHRASQGKKVVRLKGGDPFIFGRGGEEAEFLRQHDISYEIVPGVTAAVGATAYAGIPLTHRQYSSSVAFVTGHENPDKPETSVDWAGLARFSGTLVVYMGLSRLVYITRTLLQHGKPANTPAAVLHWGTTGHQQTVTAPLGELAHQAQRAGVTAPALVLIGPVVALRDRLAWFESQPLFGRRVLITRPRRQAADLAHRLELLGAIPFLLPVIEVRPLSDYTAVDHVLAELDTFDWLVFTSANGVPALLDRLLTVGRDLRALGRVKLAAIGPSTAAALARYHLRADLVPPVFRSEELAEVLLPQVRGRRVLLARADRGRDVLPQALAAVADVHQVAVYTQTDAADPQSPELDCLRRGEIEFVTLTSPNIARAFLSCLDEVCQGRIRAGETRLVTISPVTSAGVHDLGFPVAAEARAYTTDGLLSTLIDLATANSSG